MWPRLNKHNKEDLDFLEVVSNLFDRTEEVAVIGAAIGVTKRQPPAISGQLDLCIKKTTPAATRKWIEDWVPFRSR